MAWLCGALLAVLLGSAAQAQQPELLLDLRDGSQLVATALRGTPASGLQATTKGGVRKIAAADLLAVRGGAARKRALLRAELAGGDVLHGALVGGDEAGDGLELLSPMLGKVTLSIDRLAALVQPGVHAGDQLLPDGVDEALFLPTGRGYDLIAGTLHRFGARGVRFQAEGVEDAPWYSATRFSSVRLRGALPAEQPPTCTLLTRAADRLGVTVRSFGKRGVMVTHEGGDSFEVRWADLACLVFHARVVHLSDLEPVNVVESGFDGPVVHAWRRDHCVLGGELLAMGRAFGRGIGVHSKSRLTFRVPDGATHFRTRVAIDDSAVALPVQAHAEVRVVRQSKVVFEVTDLRVGREPRDSGRLPVKPGERLTLEVDFGEGRDLGDRVDWLLPMFLLRAGS